MAARRADAGAGAGSRRALRIGDEVPGDGNRGACPRGALPLRARQLRSGARDLDGGKTAPTDQELRYFSALVRGQVLRALGRSDEAVAAFRSALATWPGAQSARVALMTLLLSRGERDGAGALAEAAQAAPADEFDPWWTYWLGDYRGYPVILDRLRAFAR